MQKKWCFIGGVEIGNRIFLRHDLTKYRGSCAHWKGNSMNFSMSTEPPRGSKSHQDSKGGHSWAILLVTNWLPPCIYLPPWLWTLRSLKRSKLATGGQGRDRAWRGEERRERYEAVKVWHRALAPHRDSPLTRQILVKTLKLLIKKFIANLNL